MESLKLPIGFFQDYNPNIKKIRTDLAKNLTKTNINEPNLLSDNFFSDENIDLINKQIILTIWKKTKGKYKVEKQNKNNLLIVMQYVFMENARYLPYDIKGQIKQLNCIVVGEIYPTVITNFEQKLGYLRDIQFRQPFVDLPKSSTSDKTLPSANRENFI